MSLCKRLLCTCACGILLVACIGILICLYILGQSELDKQRWGPNTSTTERLPNSSVQPSFEDGYLVSNPKCKLVSRKAVDSSNEKFIKKEKYQSCSLTPPLTKVIREPDGKMYAVTVPKQAKRYKNISCCYAHIHRPIVPFEPEDKYYDTAIELNKCEDFKDKVVINNAADAVLVRCSSQKKQIYSNVHPILSPDKVHDKMLDVTNNINQDRKLSVLVIGMDSISRLNFQRTMPLTKKYFDKQGWFELRGYNKMGDNTFPNLMAVLSGLNESMAYSTCKPNIMYGLDYCPLIWYAFREAGYVTGHGEDSSEYSTFNYNKLGFVDPPTDYYMRPYIVASEKFLVSKKLFNSKYCTGPESSFFRVLNYAQDFAQTFINQPYFGFFWTNSASHDDANLPSSIDDKFLIKLQEMDKAGVMNDSMVILLSDHGMRYGDIRSSDSGWYEERLPVVYISLPPWFREQNPKAHHALKVNQNRLTSPYDLYETFRDILSKAGGEAEASKSCPECTSLFEDVPYVRGCSDAGINEHWCACTNFRDVSTSNQVVVGAAHKFLEFIDDIVKNYTQNGKRQCEKFKLKKIHRASRIEVLEDESTDNPNNFKIFILLEVTPGGAKYETTVNYNGKDNYSIREQDISRLTSYYHGSLCLKSGKKMFCECVK